MPDTFMGAGWQPPTLSPLPRTHSLLACQGSKRGAHEVCNIHSSPQGNGSRILPIPGGVDRLTTDERASTSLRGRPLTRCLHRLNDEAGRTRSAPRSRIERGDAAS